MKKIIYDNEYMDMELGFAYRFLNEHSVLTTAHRHNYFEYFLVTAGRIVHCVNGRRQLLSRGDLVFIRPDDYHSYERYGSETFSMTNISFRSMHFMAACQYLGGSVEQLLHDPLQPPTINILPYADCTLEASHNSLSFFVGSKDELFTRLRFLLVETLNTFFRYFRTEEESKYDAWLHTVLEQMSSQENIEEGISALLRIAGVSHSHLCRLMKQQFDMTPNQYITRLRMIYAANLLANSTESVLDISLKCGYSSLSHFITTFKKAYGIAPHNYRQIHSNNDSWK